MMKISAPSAISKFSLRLGERRRRSEAGDRPALTETDVENISDFERLLTGGIHLLEVENEALVAGDVGLVSHYYQAKSEFLRHLTARQSVIEPFLKEDIPEIISLRDLLRQLSEQLKRNGQLLEAMSTASRSILSEVERIKQRQSLAGIYDKSGNLRQGVTPIPGNVVKKL